MSSVQKSIDAEQVAKESTDLVVRCQNIVITNQEQYNDSAKLLDLIKEQKEKIGLAYDSIVEKAHEAHKEAVAKRKKYLDPLETAKGIINKLMLSYKDEQERKAQEEQIRLQKIAEKAAEEELKKLEAKIERAKASGKEEKAEELETQKENIIPIIVPVIAPAINRPTGISYRDNWCAEIVDLNLVPREYLIANMAMLNGMAKSTKGSAKISGVKFINTQSIINRN
uniref:Uncharacterized protein n=1 Tax=viral metagenome TaxID=1070528 RepID=A0A6M3JTT7_9ZZZZ